MELYCILHWLNTVYVWLQIFKADFTCPPWFSSSAKKLIKRILDPNPSTVCPPSSLHINLLYFFPSLEWCIVILGTCQLTVHANGMKQRITIAELIENEWFKKGYKPPAFEQANVSLDDVNSIFNESVVILVVLLCIMLSILVHHLWVCTWCSSWLTGFSKPSCGEARRRVYRAYGSCNHECIWTHLYLSGS